VLCSAVSLFLTPMGNYYNERAPLHISCMVALPSLQMRRITLHCGTNEGLLYTFRTETNQPEYSDKTTATIAPGTTCFKIHRATELPP
jgi:hypothetical protein